MSYLRIPDLLGNTQAIPIENIACIESVSDASAITLRHTAGNATLFTPVPVDALLMLLCAVNTIASEQSPIEEVSNVTRSA